MFTHIVKCCVEECSWQAVIISAKVKPFSSEVNSLKFFSHVKPKFLFFPEMKNC